MKRQLNLLTGMEESVGSQMEACGLREEKVVVAGGRGEEEREVGGTEGFEGQRVRDGISRLEGK